MPHTIPHEYAKAAHSMGCRESGFRGVVGGPVAGGFNASLDQERKGWLNGSDIKPPKETRPDCRSALADQMKHTLQVKGLGEQIH